MASKNIEQLLDQFIAMGSTQSKDDNIWREKPVDLVTFFTDKKYLGEKPFPGKQTELLEAVNYVINKKELGNKIPSRLKGVNEIVSLFGKGCKHGDTKIFDYDSGIMYLLKELAEESNGFSVTSMNPDTQRLERNTTTGVVKAGEGSIYEIVTNAGRRTKVYSEHIFFSRKYSASYTDKHGNKRWKGTEWKKVSELKVGDYIAVPVSCITPNGISLDKNEIRLVGYLLGDGCISDQWKCSFYASIKEVEEDYCKILRYFGIEPKYPSYSNEGRHDRACVAIDSSLTPWESRKLGGNPVTNILRKYGLQGCNAYNKHIPREFFNLNKECIIEFISALFATDGWVCITGSDSNNPIPQVGYCSVSRQLIEDVQLLLSKIGIYSRIDKKKTPSNFGIAYQLTINSRYDFYNFCDTISIVGKSQKQKEIYEYIKNTYKDRRTNGIRSDFDIMFERVKEINYIGEDSYYDLTVEDNANYVSDGFIDHNSGKDFLASGMVAYMCYWLCCLSDPQTYVGFGKGENIDIVNVALNAVQANNVFFKKLKQRIMNCPWFKRVNYNPSEEDNSTYNEYQITKTQIRFYSSITAHSTHSEADSFEGYNPIMVVFDEIAGFEKDKAQAIYDMFVSSASTRYNEDYIFIFISFPRHTEDFQMMKYAEYEKGVSNVWGIKGASWEVNPKINRASLQKHYDRDPEGAQMRYACIPPAQSEGLYRYPERIDSCTIPGKSSKIIVEEIITTRVLSNGKECNFSALKIYGLENLDPNYKYFLGGDAGIKNDTYAICLMKGVPTLTEVMEGDEVIQKFVNKPVEELLIRWKPNKKERLPVDLLNVADILEEICRRVHVESAMFDQFNSGDVIQRLQTYGVDAQDKAFSNPFQVSIHNNLKQLVYTGFIELMDNQEANDDQKHLIVENGNKITHKEPYGKDLPDARAIAAHLCTNSEPEEMSNFSMPTIMGARRQG